MSTTKKILIVDDHSIYRAGLKIMIDMTVDMVVAAEADNGLDAIRMVHEQEFDIVILDITMPGKNGLEVLADIKRVKPRLPVLMLSMHAEEQYAIRAFKSGASGYLNKICEPRQLREALERISLGKKYITPSLAEALADSLARDDQKALHEELSIREYQIMLLIAAGKMPRQIAEELSMSVKTVGTYRERILKKMNMKSTAELTRYIIQQNL